MGHAHKDAPFIPLKIAVLTVSDSRTEETDSSGGYLVKALTEAGHERAAKVILPDDLYRLRAQVSAWIADPGVEVVLVTGGTGVTGRDVTPEALLPLFDKEITGYGELFRQVSFDEIGSSTIQSRTVAGIANATLIFTMPGSSGGCRAAWSKVIGPQLDSRTQPCNFVALFPRFKEQ